MKLKNKKTGETITLKNDRELALLKFVESSLPNGFRLWEEVKEPLIKDEKIRKAVRAWAEANEREYLLVIKSGGRLEISDGSPHLIYISFHVDNDTLKILDNRTYYPIAELCGEEEE